VLRPFESAVALETTAAAISGIQPTAGSEVKLRGKMLSECSQQRVPPLITDRRWLAVQQRGLSLGRLPSVLLEELPHEFPPHFGVSCLRKAAAQFGQSHGVIGRHSMRLRCMSVPCTSIRC
jgi:hypothetical protein